MKNSFLSKKVVVKRSGIDGKGVFCAYPIKKGEIVAIWGGAIIPERELKALERRQFKKIYDYATPIAEGFFLVSSRRGQLEGDDFFNHSCQPNLGMQGHLVMVAMRDIKKGEELTYDYAMTDAGLDYAFECSCGTKACRRIIHGSDWRIPSLQRKYKGYFSFFVQQKIDGWRKQQKRRKSTGKIV